MEQIQTIIIAGILIGITIYLIILLLTWLFIKSAVKKGVEEALINVLQQLDIIEVEEQPNSHIDFEYLD